MKVENWLSTRIKGHGIRRIYTLKFFIETVLFWEVLYLPLFGYLVCEPLPCKPPLPLRVYGDARA